MAARAKAGLNVLKKTVQEFSDDDCPRMAAALAYYAVFSLPPLLVILFLVLGTVVDDPAQAQQFIEQQMGNLIGEQAQEQVPAMIESAREKLQGGFGFSLLLSIGGLLFSATGAFAQLQRALNNAWNVEPTGESGGVKGFLTKRVLSFGMILAIAFLLLVSLALSAAVSLLTTRLSTFLPDVLSGPLLWGINEAVSLGVITILFATIFKVLPDVRIGWRDVWVGAFATAFLFVLGKALIGVYLGQSNPGSTFGQAGALAVILVWVYYSSLIFFVGAEFTQVWARHYGARIEPDKGAVRVVEEKRRVSSDELDEGEASPTAEGDGSDADGSEEDAGTEDSDTEGDGYEEVRRAEDEARPDADVR